MEAGKVIKQINADLIELCVSTHNRHVGSPGNRRATEYAAVRMAAAGWAVTQPEFDCIDWEYGEIILKVGDELLGAYISPYSPACEIGAPFDTVANVEELASRDWSGKIAVFHGELCREQIMPRNFVFYNPEEHRRIIRILDEKKPLAVIAITSHNPELAGGQYPFPLFEDGDFDIPSAYLTEEEGAKLLTHQGSRVYLKIDSRRIPAKGFNVIGRKPGYASERIVFCAHIDTKKDTPGALDNGTGIAVLLTLADMLRSYTGRYGIELLAVNGEDYYAAPGQMKYIADNQDDFGQIVLAVNTDGAGYISGRTSYCCLGCGDAINQAVGKALGDRRKFVTTELWYQGDHGWFAMHEVPAVAITSEEYMELSANITHTPKDNLEIVDPGKVYEIADALRELVSILNG